MEGIKSANKQKCILDDVLVLYITLKPKTKLKPTDYFDLL